LNAVVHPKSSRQSSPKRHAMASYESFFALFGGPLAWFLQLNAGFALASQPCFQNGERTAVPHLGADWTWPAMIASMIIACAIALLATLLSWRAYARTEDGRARFLALWGIFLGAGSTLATASTAVAVIVLPQCAG
jgi:hypothetical protein